MWICKFAMAFKWLTAGEIQIGTFLVTTTQLLQS